MADTGALKRAVGEAAAAQVGEGMVVGLGTGSTAAFVVDALARRVREGLRIVAIPTSERTAAQARAGGIPLVDFDTHPEIDLTIDGADQVERPTLNLIKGMGGALLREKIVAAASRRFLVVVDETKIAPGLSLPVPVEVVPFGWQATEAHLRRLGARTARRVESGGAPYKTDGGNAILDCNFGPIADPAALDRALHDVVGVVETGLFIGRVEAVLVAGGSGVYRLEKQARP